MGTDVMASVPIFMGGVLRLARDGDGKYDSNLLEYCLTDG